MMKAFGCLHLFLKDSDASVPHPSTNHDTGTDDSLHVAAPVQQEKV